MKIFTSFFVRLMVFLFTIAVFSTCSPVQAGSLSGVVMNCYNNTPIAGAVVTVSLGYSCTTNAAGLYFFASLPDMLTQVNATALGCIPAQVIVLISGPTICNIYLCPVPATLTGFITNCVTGEPVEGVKVAFDLATSTYSNAAGIYELHVFPLLTGSVSFSKSGFNSFEGPGMNVLAGTTTTLNVQLKPELSVTAHVMASLNGTQTVANISWDPATDMVNLLHDDGIPEQCSQTMVPGTLSAVKFTPCGYPATILSCRVYLCGTPANFAPFNVYLYNDDGPGGMPGTTLAGPFPDPVLSPGWNEIAFPVPVDLATGSFYIVMEQGGIYPNCAGLAVDTTANQFESFLKPGTGPWVPAGGNFLIRAMVNEPCGLVPPSAVNYQVSRMVQGQEGTPATWIPVGTVTATDTITDPAWSTLPCGPYRWAVNATYPCNGSTPVAFSNVLGKCWTANVTIHGEKCCSSLPNGNMNITFRNLDFPDTVYYAITDITGTAQINNMWKGNYQLTASCSGCTPVTQAPVAITHDITLNIVLSQGSAPAPANLTVNDTTLLATWNKPASTACLQGYNFTPCNNVLGFFTSDTSAYLDPIVVSYGQPCTACVVAFYGFNTPAFSLPVCVPFVSHNLFPPVDFHADSIECTAYLSWTKPDLMSGSTNRPVLLGYNIYRNGAFVHFCPSPDSVSYYDQNLDPGNYGYTCTAKYDLTPCGFNGQTGESMHGDAKDSVVIICGYLLPFVEGWNQGTFGTNGWTFEPSQGNWNIEYGTGNPAPAAGFSWSGKQMDVNYSFAMESPPIDASQLTCPHLFLDFEMKLEDRFSTSTEKMTVEILYDNAWHVVGEFLNNGSFDWTTKTINIDAAMGLGIKVRFRAHGENSYNILHWYIDNIKIYEDCSTSIGPGPASGLAEVRLYPDPAEDHLMIESNTPIIKAEVMMATGTVIYSGNYKDTVTVKLNTSGFPAGVYFLRLTTSSGIIGRKFIVLGK
jgi:hypothetical protein